MGPTDDVVGIFLLVVDTGAGASLVCEVVCILSTLVDTETGASLVCDIGETLELSSTGVVFAESTEPKTVSRAKMTTVLATHHALEQAVLALARCSNDTKQAKEMQDQKGN